MYILADAINEEYIFYIEIYSSHNLSQVSSYTCT
jgi:hypothetical protein